MGKKEGRKDAKADHLVSRRQREVEGRRERDQDYGSKRSPFRITLCVVVVSTTLV